MWKSKDGVCDVFGIISIAERQGMKRGWFTYTDLCALLEQSAWSQALAAIYQHFTKVRSLGFHFTKMAHFLNTPCVLMFGKMQFFLFCFQISCMLGLFYLTSVAGLIATCAVLQQLSLSRYGQTELPPPADLNLAQPQNANLSPEASSAAQHLPCCIMKNKSLNCQTRSPGTTRIQTPTWASSHTSYSCVWRSLLASLGHVHRESNSKMEVRGASTSKYCPDSLKSLPPRHCGLGNNSALPPQGAMAYHQRHALGTALNSGLHALPPVRAGACSPDYLLAIDKSPALLLRG